MQLLLYTCTEVYRQPMAGCRLHSGPVPYVHQILTHWRQSPNDGPPAAVTSENPNKKRKARISFSSRLGPVMELVWLLVTDLVQQDPAELVLRPGTEAGPVVLQVVRNSHLVLCGQQARR